MGVVPQAAGCRGGARPRIPPSNLSCATAWAQRASRFPPLGGGEAPIYTAVDHHKGGSF